MLKIYKGCIISIIYTFSLIMQITSQKVIEFYKNNPNYNVNKINELFVNFILSLRIAGVKTTQLDRDFFISSLSNIDKKLESLETNQRQMDERIQDKVSSCLNESKSFYSEKLEETLRDKLKNTEHDVSNIMSLVRETNNTFIEKIGLQLQSNIPIQNKNITENLKSVLETNIQRDIKPLLNDKSKNQEQIQNIIEHKIPIVCGQIFSNAFDNKIKSLESSQQFVSQSVTDIQKYLENIIDIQKNSTLKGKESEDKIETLLVSNFPSANIKNTSGEPKSCDFLLERHNKVQIMIENKDYKSNVPNDEIRKFIRDVEYQSKHAIILSQHTGIQNKENFQIDIHMGNILVYVHHVNYDISKINIAINLIDHLHYHLSELMNKDKINISSDDLQSINKEYLNFIQEKNSMIENFKKFYRDHLKQLESFEMNTLTTLLNTKFSNVEQLTYKCTICNQFVGKTKRALTTHQNKCKKEHSSINKTDKDNHQSQQKNKIPSPKPQQQIIQSKVQPQLQSNKVNKMSNVMIQNKNVTKVQNQNNTIQNSLNMLKPSGQVKTKLNIQK